MIKFYSKEDQEKMVEVTSTGQRIIRDLMGDALACTLEFSIIEEDDGWFNVHGDVILKSDNVVDFTFSCTYPSRDIAEQVIREMKRELAKIENQTTLNTRGIRPWRFR